MQKALPARHDLHQLMIQKQSFQPFQLEIKQDHAEGFSFKIAFLSGFGEKYACAFFQCQWHIAMSQACLKNDLVISFLVICNLSVTVQDRARMARKL